MKAVKSTAQVTRAMQMVAASKMKYAQQAAINSRPYAQILAQLFSALDPELLVGNPLFEKRDVITRGILVIAPDKGLCGGLITNLNKEIVKLPQDAVYIAVGKRASLTLNRLKRHVLAEFPLSDKTRFSELRSACEMLLNSFLQNVVDTFEVLHTEYDSPVKQHPALQPILPIASFADLTESFPHDTTTPAPIPDDTRPFVVEPDPTTILLQLLPLYIKQEVFHAALEAKASEHSSRMVAMKNATDNANELNATLTLSYNKARQAAITNEILEIAAAGASANN